MKLDIFIATKLSSSCWGENFLITIFVVNIGLLSYKDILKLKFYVQALSHVCIDEELLFGMMPNHSYILTDCSITDSWEAKANSTR